MTRRADPALADKIKRAQRHYRITHWGDDGEYNFREMECADPSGTLVHLGELTHLKYLAHKKGNPGLRIYEHDFGVIRPVLAYEPDRGKLVIAGGRYRVTALGIVG